MLRLDKTAFRIVPMHHDQDAEDIARRHMMTADEKQEIVVYLRQQAKVLHAFRELGRQQDRDKNKGENRTE